MSKGDGDSALRARARAAKAEKLSHNLLGQRLGRKGRNTRERIIAAAEHLLASDGDAPISLSAVAREANLGMTTIYLYFSDFTELLLAVLEPLMASAHVAYVEGMQRWWPDEQLGEHCSQFVESFYSFWARHARVLHLRHNLMENDERLRNHRVSAITPVIRALVLQMGGNQDVLFTPDFGMATVIVTGLDRVVDIATDASFTSQSMSPGAGMQNLLRSQARLLELAIRDRRAVNGAEGAKRAGGDA